ncbi:NAD(P)-binding protein [Trametopsis cervina]|nr:NAD(P)-binding protein [Trametopsis cervina]
MPAVKSGLVLVTGGNGYIAVHLTKYLFEAGFSVRSTVRSEKSVPYLKNLFKEYESKYELVIVPDITKEGAFDEAVKGVDAVLHTASPFHYHTDDPSEIIDPAVKGTTSILNSVLKHGQSVRRFVLTSSIAAHMSTSYDSYPVSIDDDSWNTTSEENIKKLGKEATQTDKYFASKTLAEKAFWEFYGQHKSEVQWDTATIAFPFAYGPALHEVSSPEKLNQSLSDFFDAIVKPTKPINYETPSALIDSRDAAYAHVLALQTEEASGQRFLIVGSGYYWQMLKQIARQIDPSLPEGPAFDLATAFWPIRAGAAKAQRILGLKLRSVDETVKDSLAYFKEKGWY